MSTDSIRAIARAMLLLRTLNMQLESSLHSLYLQTGLPKPTIFRILRTLMLEGYVHSVGDGGHYRLTSKVEELAAGYTEKSAVVDVGSPVVLSLTREIQWPLAIGTLDGDAIVVRYSTMPYSPVAVHATTLGQRLGLLDTAMGRVYLAFCPSNERTKLLQLLRNAAPDGLIEVERHLADELELVRRQGYAVRKPNTQRSSATVAVAILRQKRVLATLCLTTFGRSLTSGMVAQYVPILKNTAAEISDAFNARIPD